MMQKVPTPPHLGGCWLQGDPYTTMPDVWQRLITDYGIKSVLDLGCGAGHATQWFAEHGVSAIGVDGDYEALDKTVAKGLVTQHDFTLGPYVPPQPMDMCWCAEFLEHVDEQFEANYMTAIRSCKYACVTHAVPGQPGHHHVTCQPDGYWIAAFDRWGFDHVTEETAKLRATNTNNVPWGRNTLMFFKRRKGVWREPVSLDSGLRDQIAKLIPTMEGWATVEAATAMASLVVRTRPKLVVEIGVFGGRSLAAMGLALASTCQPCNIIGIDPWRTDLALEGDHDPQEVDWWSKVDLAKIQRGCVEKIWSLNLSSIVIIVQAGSHECLPVIPNNIDILYIDGNHTEIASVRDVSGYLPKVKDRGFIWMDDTDWPSMSKAVELMDAKCERVGQQGHCVLFQKR